MNNRKKAFLPKEIEPTKIPAEVGSFSTAASVFRSCERYQQRSTRTMELVNKERGFEAGIKKIQREING